MVVIKRDGSREKFDASKLNKWAEWASEIGGKYVDWTEIVLTAASRMPNEVTSKQIQELLIQTCLDNNSWSHNLMGGRLYAALTFKEFYDNKIPTVKELHDKLYELDLMVKLDYSDEEYEKIEKFINHELDYKSSYSELQHIRKKYSIQNRVEHKEYESQQFVYMRMAMALSENEKHDRLKTVKGFYEHLSAKRINAPTPNYVNLGTRKKGFASCLVYTTNDTAKSLAVGDHIAYMMTCQSAGIGSHLNTRSLGDPVNGGLIKHQGKLPYYKALDGAVHANLQSGRGGAVTTYFTCYDPEIETLLQLKNPMSTEDKRIRGLDYSFGANKFFARKAAKNETYFTFTSFSAPDLYEAFYSKDQDKFEELYNKYENDESFEKNYLNARDILVSALNESYETGRMYLHFPDAMNTHTPFNDTIYSSNLCAEIALPTRGYSDMLSLYSEEPQDEVVFLDENGVQYEFKSDDVIGINGELTEAYNIKLNDEVEVLTGAIYSETTNEMLFETREKIKVSEIIRNRNPEMGLCSLAGICVDKIKSEEQYEDTMYYALKMIDKCIDMSEYVLPHLGTTAKNRRSAGVSIIGLAHYMAQRKLSYSSQEGLDEIHRLSERHYYYALKASLRLGKELGNAKWMYKTKWKNGWLPIDTYAKTIDGITNTPLQYDWEELRQQVIENGGIRHSVLTCSLPSESSSIASGTTNGVYPIRSLTLIKGDANKVTYWAAPESEKLEKYYEIAWDIKPRDLIKVYAVIQKWTDQAISADLYADVSDSKVSASDMVKDYLEMCKYSQKTRYYMNTLTTRGTSLDDSEVCESCTL